MKANKERAYTPEQLQVADRTAMQLAAMPKDTRRIAVMVANAYIEGLLAGQGLKEGTTGREVLAD